jgi:hypothetical protein
VVKGRLLALLLAVVVGLLGEITDPRRVGCACASFDVFSASITTAATRPHIHPLATKPTKSILIQWRTNSRRASRRSLAWYVITQAASSTLANSMQSGIAFAVSLPTKP